MNSSIDDVYKKVGEALHMGQTLEFLTRTLVAILNDNFDVQIEIEALVIREDRKTLGQLIGLLKSHADIDDVGASILKQALVKRNYVAHEFYIKNTYLFNDLEHRNKVYQTLVEDTKTIALGTALMSGFVEGFCESLAIDKSKVLVKQSI
ncbi:TPA: hypothetical protein ACF39K_004567 [Vibrio parahaemolyticus]|uniref:hypothetical protein n=1 Tax=Vibrio parahaemolyticus TaxID=670 RepID=UPI001A8D5633|nr:hypothetical protein [Vibrio parahaemolyticus]MBO0160019.1 hypothetical protein [Vibrio parahaemolyticus]MBO0175228.1 hypothetical protein [Vibrio parahaemolyticus]MEA5286001.1 hypothetical protein [Vibrio parahaemolyticus]HBH7918950.1 hypothetical protein [Vibrio parahaemolyticus]HCE1578205.1 hypothetical protein [Vibrio parahaemolyticus]